MKKKVALYAIHGDGEYLLEYYSFREDDDDYTLLAEVYEVNFVPIPDSVIVPAKIKAIDAGIERLRADLGVKVAVLEVARNKLLAIEHVPEELADEDIEDMVVYATGVLESMDSELFLVHLDPEWKENFAHDVQRGVDFYTKDMTPGEFKKALDESGCRE